MNPDLVARDEQGKPYTVRYEAVNAMLLNEFLKEHRTVQEQEATIAQLKSAVAKRRRLPRTSKSKLKPSLRAYKRRARSFKRANSPQDESAVGGPAPQVVNNP